MSENTSNLYIPKAQYDAKVKSFEKAIALMYQALLQISCVSSVQLTSDKIALARAQEIADNALQIMHVEHTNKIQKVLGIL